MKRCDECRKIDDGFDVGDYKVNPRVDVLRPSLLDRKSTRLNSSHVVISYAV